LPSLVLTGVPKMYEQTVGPGLLAAGLETRLHPTDQSCSTDRMYPCSLRVL